MSNDRTKLFSVLLESISNHSATSSTILFVLAKSESEADGHWTRRPKKIVCKQKDIRIDELSGRESFGRWLSGNYDSVKIIGADNVRE